VNAQVDPRTLLLESFRAAVAAADPLEIVAAHLPPPHAGGRTLVVGAGKAAASMALAVERAYQGKASWKASSSRAMRTACRPNISA
jgi:hydroxypyruvate reductase